jgi:predicted nucleotidyltransferase component of viral defense system
MIPRAYITEWQEKTPWQLPEQIEQDLLISQALVKIYQNELLASHLAFRGGTALYKLFMNPATRYSEDIDLVQIKAGPIKEIVRNLQAVFAGFEKSTVKRAENSFKLFYHYASEIEPVQKMRIKIEINSREHFTVLGWNSIPFAMDSSFFRSESIITTYKPEELLGTKLRALYQRSKGRDLYDLFKFLSATEPNHSQIIESYKTYMEFSLRESGKHGPTKIEFEKNLSEKMNNPEFIGDTKALLRPGEVYNPWKAFHLVMNTLIEDI